jgi:hypothetical protein
MEVDVEFDSETGTYRTVHDFSTDVPLSTTVVLAVEQVVDEVDDVLYDAIDPDALDAIFRPHSDVAPYRRGYVEFVVSGHLITVRADGVIEIDPSLDEENGS